MTGLPSQTLLFLQFPDREALHVLYSCIIDSLLLTFLLYGTSLYETKEFSSVKIDGFEQDKHVVVIAATNRKEDLDPALIRCSFLSSALFSSKKNPIKFSLAYLI
jgi:hypothetical protein